jgi:putative membrane protein
VSERTQPRKPAAFRLDDPRIVVAPRSHADDDAPRRRGAVTVTPEPENQAVVVVVAPPRRRGFGWGKVFWWAFGGLTLLGLGLAVTRLVEDLFARAEWLGFLALSIAAIAALALAVVIARESVGLARLAAVEKLRERAEAAIAADDRTAARAVVHDLLGLVRAEPRLARARSAMGAHVGAS